ncbi:hypothetical protein [Nonomuraea cavernae]
MTITSSPPVQRRAASRHNRHVEPAVPERQGLAVQSVADVQQG